MLICPSPVYKILKEKEKEKSGNLGRTFNDRVIT